MSITAGTGLFVLVGSCGSPSTRKVVRTHAPRSFARTAAISSEILSSSDRYTPKAQLKSKVARATPAVGLSRVEKVDFLLKIWPDPTFFR